MRVTAFEYMDYVMVNWLFSSIQDGHFILITWTKQTYAWICHSFKFICIYVNKLYFFLSSYLANYPPYMGVITCCFARFCWVLVFGLRLLPSGLWFWFVGSCILFGILVAQFFPYPCIWVWIQLYKLCFFFTWNVRG